MNISLRKWEKSDLTSLVKYANNPEIAKNLTNVFPYPYTETDGIRFIERAQAAMIFAIDYNQEAIGGIGLHPQTDIFSINGELGYWLAEEFWGKGIMSQAVQLMIRYAWDNTELHRLFARPFGSNTGSQRVLEKCGFVLEARISKNIIKYGELQDELIYAIRRP